MSADEQVSVSVDLESGYRFEVDFHQEGVPPLTVDEPAPLGRGEGPNPARLLAAATASCLAASAVFCLSKARIEVQSLRADATASLARDERRRWRIGRIAVRLHPVVAEADLARVDRCLELFEDYCVVTQSVRGGVTVDVAVAPVVAGEQTTPELRTA